MLQRAGASVAKGSMVLRPAEVGDATADALVEVKVVGVEELQGLPLAAKAVWVQPWCCATEPCSVVTAACSRVATAWHWRAAVEEVHVECAASDAVRRVREEAKEGQADLQGLKQGHCGGTTSKAVSGMTFC